MIKSKSRPQTSKALLEITTKTNKDKKKKNLSKFIDLKQLKKIESNDNDIFTLAKYEKNIKKENIDKTLNNEFKLILMKKEDFTTENLINFSEGHTLKRNFQRSWEKKNQEFY